MKTITLAQLESLHACDSQVQLFRETFGESVTVSLELAEQYAEQFNFAWAAKNLLSKSALADYRKISDAALNDCDKIHNAALADYLKIYNAALKDYRKIGDAAYADYIKIRNAAYADYCKIGDAAWADYCKICATTFARFYLAQGEYKNQRGLVISFWRNKQ